MVGSCRTNRFACMRGQCVQVAASNATANDWICVCDPGWTHDNSLFHFNNCSLPENALLGLFLAFGVVVGIPLAMMFALAARSAKAKMKRMALLTFIACLTFFANTLVLYLDNGVFEAMAVTLGINTAAINLVSQNILELTVAPVVAVNHRKIDERVSQNLRRFFIAVRIGFIILGCIAAGLTRTDRHNYMIITFLLYMSLVIVLCTALQIVYVQHLIDVIQKQVHTSVQVGLDVQSDPNKMCFLDVLTKLQKFRRSLIAYMVQGPIMTIAIVSLFFGLDQQLPYVWTLYPLLCMTQFIRYYSCLVLLRRESAPSLVAGFSSSHERGKSPSSKRLQNGLAHIGNTATNGGEIVPASSASRAAT